MPNPLFDLAGIMCGQFGIPFWEFFLSTLIGKALIKTHIQVCGTILLWGCLFIHFSCIEVAALFLLRTGLFDLFVFNVVKHIIFLGEIL